MADEICKTCVPDKPEINQVMIKSEESCTAEYAKVEDCMIESKGAIKPCKGDINSINIP